MTITSASDAIESLLEMAEQGEIDPWDVQVIDVIDRFLAELGLLNDLDLAMAQANLPQSGQAFLWASMLVLFKADTLERLSLEQQEESLIDEEISDLERELRTLPRYLENHIRRRTAAPPPRKRRVTLQELITQLQQIALEIEALPKLPVVVPKPRPQSRREAVQIITELAHQENLTELAAELDFFLQRKFFQLEKNEIEFEYLLDLWQAEKPSSHSATQEKVAIFWALLLLASQSKVELKQEDFYQDLTISLIRVC
ncbi:segregation/condensation protein A [Microcystis sp. M061S2]|uniref:segregation/condensation protein A n=1 Tax=Microcystis sp. M061S2 TaxID=2771171 RepID=UPI0025843E27|nr:segregation/condensation protein A [Microcystis sp. M061S2]MCA2654457.1 segregation/condensation protein A [Microcystis sp. M061S2]